jgi:hypothetical protein
MRYPTVRSRRPAAAIHLLGEIKRLIGEPVCLAVVVAAHVGAAPVVEPLEESRRLLVRALEALVLHPVLPV